MNAINNDEINISLDGSNDISKTDDVKSPQDNY